MQACLHKAPDQKEKRYCLLKHYACYLPLTFQGKHLHPAPQPQAPCQKLQIFSFTISTHEHRQNTVSQTTDVSIVKDEADFYGKHQWTVKS